MKELELERDGLKKGLKTQTDILNAVQDDSVKMKNNLGTKDQELMQMQSDMSQ